MVYVCKVTAIFLLHVKDLRIEMNRNKIKISNRSRPDILLIKIKLQILKSILHSILLFFDYIYYPFPKFSIVEIPSIDTKLK